MNGRKLVSCLACTLRLGKRHGQNSSATRMLSSAFSDLASPDQARQAALEPQKISRSEVLHAKQFSMESGGCEDARGASSKLRLVLTAFR